MNFTPTLALLLVACGGGLGEATRTSERDSAGVRIVENRGEPAPLPWRIDTVPLVDIGGESADSNQQLFGVTSVLRMHDGRIVVSNDGTGQLRFFDASGRFVGATGRKGEGPGEFRNVGLLFPYQGDSLLVTDDRLRRISIFDSKGTFGRSFTIQTSAEVPFASVIGVFDDRTLLGQGGVSTGGAVPSGLQRYDIPLYHLDGSAAPLMSLGQFPGSEMFFEALGRGFTIHMAMFARTTRYLVGGSYFYVAANDTYEIQRHRPDGTPDQILRWIHEPRRVTSDDMEAERARRLANARTDNAKRDAERLFNEIPHPATFPAYGTVIVDDSLNLWVGDYVPATRSPTTWTVFDSSGRMLGTIANPQGFVPDQIGQDFLLGRWRDELDVEHVRLYSLTR